MPIIVHFRVSWFVACCQVLIRIESVISGWDIGCFFSYRIASIYPIGIHVNARREVFSTRSQPPLIETKGGT